MNAPERLRFRIGLRWLFAIVTVLAIPSAWIGWNFAVIRQRHDLLAEVAVPPGVAIPGDPLLIIAKISNAVPYNLRLFGENGVDQVRLFFTAEAPPQGDQLERIVKLFPEADIVVYHGIRSKLQSGCRPGFPFFEGKAVPSKQPAKG